MQLLADFVVDKAFVHGFRQRKAGMDQRRKLGNGFWARGTAFELYELGLLHIRRYKTKCIVTKANLRGHVPRVAAFAHAPCGHAFVATSKLGQYARNAFGCLAFGAGNLGVVLNGRRGF
jgi:hypothetical protein